MFACQFERVQPAVVESTVSTANEITIDGSIYELTQDVPHIDTVPFLDSRSQQRISVTYIHHKLLIQRSP
jgi:hypothetical protein